MSTSSKIVIQQLQALASLDVEKTAQRRGIPTSALLGVATAELRKAAKRIGPNEALAEELWTSTFHEARVIAVLIFPSSAVSEGQLDRWLDTINSWDLCDQFAKHLASKVPEVDGLILRWAVQQSLYTRRAALAVIANVCMRTAELNDATIERFVSIIENTSIDDRRHVKQACCWALRELGKINDSAHERAIHVALELIESADKSSAWVGRCAYKELETLVKVPERRRLLPRKSKSAGKHG